MFSKELPLKHATRLKTRGETRPSNRPRGFESASRWGHRLGTERKRVRKMSRWRDWLRAHQHWACVGRRNLAQSAPDSNGRAPNVGEQVFLCSPSTVPERNCLKWCSKPFSLWSERTPCPQQLQWGSCAHGRVSWSSRSIFLRDSIVVRSLALHGY